MSAHAFNPPSGMAAIVQCARWARMNAEFPDRSDPGPAAEGEAAHWCVTEIHAGRPPALGTRAPNGVQVDDEMLAGARQMAALLTGPGWVLETTLRGPDPMFFGTPDALRVEDNLVRIVDFKYGHGVVDAWENWQLLAYAVLWLAVHGTYDPAIDFEFVIVQPRAFNRGHAYRTWRVTGERLREYHVRMTAAMERSREPEPLATTGPACEHCPGRHACPELQRVGLRAAERAGDGSPVDMTPVAAGTELAFLKQAAALLDARITGLAAEVESHLRAGRGVPGWTMQSTEGREVWTVPDEQVVAMGPAFGLTLGKPKALTPAQARSAGLAPDVVAALSHRAAGGVKLVRDDGRRAAKAFDAGVNS